MDYRPDLDLFLSRRAAGDFVGRDAGSFHLGTEQSIFHRVARAVRADDRLRADADGGLHGDALREIPPLGLGRRRVGGGAGAVLPRGRDGQTLFRPGGRNQPFATAALRRPRVRPAPIRPAGVRQPDFDRHPAGLHRRAAGVSPARAAADFARADLHHAAVVGHVALV